MAIDRDNEEMRCPKCRHFSLKKLDEGITCEFCSYRLSRGQATNFRLFKLLKEDQTRKKHYRPKNVRT